MLGHSNQDETEKTHHLLQVHKKLAGMLNANGLEAFVANRLLEEILVLASAEMEHLSGRYQLTLEEDDLLVVDIWNAGERRDVRSLSGGETFLASLSLALAMIEYLSQGSPLESLFIDEGFGTLDSETLEAVTQTLEGLQAKGRLVGVITHVPELAERLPVQIRIEDTVAAYFLNQGLLVSTRTIAPLMLGVLGFKGLPYLELLFRPFREWAANPIIVSAG